MTENIVYLILFAFQNLLHITVGYMYKRKETNEGEEYQPNLLLDSFMEVNYGNLHYPKIIKLLHLIKNVC